MAEIYIDISKAFDFVDHGKILNVLRELGVPNKLTTINCFLFTWYDNDGTLRWVISSTFSLQV